jgi:lysine 2,3-aminomutase
MTDRVDRIGGSLIQHGTFNDRIYLMSLDKTDYPGILKEMAIIARENRYSKIFAKIPLYALDGFLDAGYIEEARIPGFFNKRDDACFMGKFLEPGRKIERFPQKIGEIIDTAQAKEPVQALPIPDGVSYRTAVKEDAESICEVYKEVFETYPFPIHDPEYIRQTMDENFIYFTLWDGDTLAAVSSTEMYPAYSNVEMTDFATLPNYRGNGGAQFLLQKMEEEMGNRGITGAYTIARAYSFGMNITFARNNYTFGGTLTNNTNISGSMESMNIWYKSLK